MIAGAPVVMGVLGWVELRDVARSQARENTEELPAISQVRWITEANQP